MRTTQWHGLVLGFSFLFLLNSLAVSLQADFKFDAGLKSNMPVAPSGSTVHFFADFGNDNAGGFPFFFIGTELDADGNIDDGRFVKLRSRLDEYGVFQESTEITDSLEGLVFYLQIFIKKNGGGVAATNVISLEIPENGPQNQSKVCFVVDADQHLTDQPGENPTDRRLKLRHFLQNFHLLGADFAMFAGDTINGAETGPLVEEDIANYAKRPVYALSNDGYDFDGNDDGVLLRTFNFDDIEFAMFPKQGQIENLHNYLADLPAGTPLVYMQHEEIFKTHTSRKWELTEGTEAETLIAIHGHYHVDRSHIDADTDITEQIAPMDDGFLVVNVYEDGRTAVNLHPYDLEEFIHMTHPAPGENVPSRPQEIFAHVFNSFSIVKEVEYSFDSDNWESMTQQNHRLWSAFANLDGQNSITIRATDGNDNQWEKTTTFNNHATVAPVNTADNWRQWGQKEDNQRGVSSSLQLPLQMAWCRDIPGRRLSQAVLSDGQLYFTASKTDYEENNALWAVDANTGLVQWQAPLYASQAGTPAVLQNNGQDIVAAVDHYRNIQAFDHSGQKLWHEESPYNGGTYLSASNQMFVASGGQAYDMLTGITLWKTDTKIYGALAVGGTRIFGHTDQNKVGGALDVFTGQQEWANEEMEGNCMHCNGKVMSGSYCLNDGSGSILWNRNSNSQKGSWATVDHEQGVYVAGNTIEGVDLSNGQTLWSISPDDEASLNAPAMDSRYAYISDRDSGMIYVVDTNNGNILDTYDLGDDLASIIVSGNTVFVTGNDGCVYALTSAD